MQPSWLIYLTVLKFLVSGYMGATEVISRARREVITSSESGSNDRILLDNKKGIPQAVYLNDGNTSARYEIPKTLPEDRLKELTDTLREEVQSLGTAKAFNNFRNTIEQESATAKELVENIKADPDDPFHKAANTGTLKVQTISMDEIRKKFFGK